MASGLMLGGYFFYTHSGEEFKSIFNQERIRTAFFRRCDVVNNEIKFFELERYQMYVPIDDYPYNFETDKVYDLIHVTEGAFEKDKTGTINLSHEIYPTIYTIPEFIRIRTKNTSDSSLTLKLLQDLKDLIEQIRKKDQDDLNNRLGRLN